jgi:hypothetical protein
VGLLFKIGLSQRKDKRISLPTGVKPIFSYSKPEHFNTTDQLVPVTQGKIDELLEEHYPNPEPMFTHTPAFLYNIAFPMFTKW